MKIHTMKIIIRKFDCFYFELYFCIFWFKSFFPLVWFSIYKYSVQNCKSTSPCGRSLAALEKWLLEKKQKLQLFRHLFRCTSWPQNSGASDECQATNGNCIFLSFFAVYSNNFHIPIKEVRQCFTPLPPL